MKRALPATSLFLAVRNAQFFLRPLSRCFPSYLLLHVRYLLEVSGVIRYMAAFKTDLFFLFFPLGQRYDS